MKLIKLQDTLSPDLLRKAKACGNPERLLKAMGTAVVSLAQLQGIEHARHQPRVRILPLKH